MIEHFREKQFLGVDMGDDQLDKFYQPIWRDCFPTNPLHDSIFSITE
jgi:hypothetical protein